MAQGDAWEISLAAPIRNYRFNQWGPKVEDGPMFWEPHADQTTTEMVNCGGRAAAYGAGSVAYCPFTQWMGQGSLPPTSIYLDSVIKQRSSHGVWPSIQTYLHDGTTSNTKWFVDQGAQADWTVGRSTAVGPYTNSHSCRVYVWPKEASANFSVAEWVVRYTPSTWSTNGYETLSSFPDPDGLHYGPILKGTLKRTDDSFASWYSPDNRAEKWSLRVSYSNITDADYQTLRKYYMANRGGWDGVPRPVAIRPYLLASGDVGGPEVLVGLFTSFDFQPTGGIGSYWSGSFTLEEM